VSLGCDLFFVRSSSLVVESTLSFSSPISAVCWGKVSGRVGLADGSVGVFDQHHVIATTKVGNDPVLAICMVGNLVCCSNSSGKLAVWRDTKLADILLLDQPVTKFVACKDCIVGVCPFGVISFQISAEGNVVTDSVWNMLGVANGVAAVDPKSSLDHVVVLDKQGFLMTWNGSHTLHQLQVSSVPVSEAVFASSSLLMILQTGPVKVHQVDVEASNALLRACVIVQSRWRAKVVRALYKSPSKYSILKLGFSSCALAFQLAWVNAKVIAAATALMEDEKMTPELAYLQVEALSKPFFAPFC
jgi:hypothetical protein